MANSDVLKSYKRVNYLKKDESLFERLRLLEERLLQHESRTSVKELEELISDDFVEFGSSGYIYNKQDIIEDLPSSPQVKMTMLDFQLRVLSNDVVLTTYRIVKYPEDSGEKKYSLRSSIWRLHNDKWQMIFHQGTPTEVN